MKIEPLPPVGFESLKPWYKRLFSFLYPTEAQIKAKRRLKAIAHMTHPSALDTTDHLRITSLDPKDVVAKTDEIFYKQTDKNGYFHK